ncbi:MAG: hypothetical protein MUE49_09910 [Rhodospirillales bacterium]|nr:hypothetical protein [Rhodospirillales bacterium]
MRTWTMALFGATTTLALSAGSAHAYSSIIYDSLPLQPTFSRVQQFDRLVPSGGFIDEIGPQFGFRSGGIGVDWGFTGQTINSVTFTLFTNLGIAGTVVNGAYIGFADLFLDLPPVGGQKTPSFDYAIDFFSEGPAAGQSGLTARLVASPTFQTANDIYSTNSLIAHGGLTNICDGGAGCAADARAPEVKVTGGQEVLAGLTVTDGGPTTVIGPSGSQDFLHSYSVMLSGLDFSHWAKIRAFWGTGWCANDTVEGTAVVPIPAALPIIGAALAGFGFAGWRQRQVA